MTFVLLIRNGDYLKVVQILVNGMDTDPNAFNNRLRLSTTLHLAVK